MTAAMLLDVANVQGYILMLEAVHGHNVVACMGNRAWLQRICG